MRDDGRPALRIVHGCTRAVSLILSLAAAVMVGGSGFDTASQVYWGAYAASLTDVVSSNFMVATAPRGADLSLLQVKTSAGSARWPSDTPE